MRISLAEQNSFHVIWISKNKVCLFNTDSIFSNTRTDPDILFQTSFGISLPITARYSDIHNQPLSLYGLIDQASAQEIHEVNRHLVIISEIKRDNFSSSTSIFSSSPIDGGKSRRAEEMVHPCLKRVYVLKRYKKG